MSTKCVEKHDITLFKIKQSKKIERMMFGYSFKILQLEPCFLFHEICLRNTVDLSLIFFSSNVFF